MTDDTKITTLNPHDSYVRVTQTAMDTYIVEIMDDADLKNERHRQIAHDTLLAMSRNAKLITLVGKDSYYVAERHSNGQQIVLQYRPWADGYGMSLLQVFTKADGDRVIADRKSKRDRSQSRRGGRGGRQRRVRT